MLGPSSQGRGTPVKILRDILFIIVLAVLTGLTVNVFSTRGIALVGDWDIDNGVVSAKAKNQPVSHDIEIKTVQEAYTIFRGKSAVFLDARDGALYAEGHIKGAVHLFVNDYPRLFGEFLQTWPLDQPIVTYCSGRECEDSHTLARYLKEDGYTDVRVFIDGYPAWVKEGLPVEKAH